MRHIRTLLVPAIALFLGVGCGGPKGKAASETKPTVAVSVVTATRSDVTRTIQLLGSLQGDQQATVMPKMAGRVTEIARPEGSFVNEGDPIVFVVNDIPGMDYKPGPVRAPISGVVGKVYVEIGQTVAPTMPVATVASFSGRVRAKAPVSDADLPFIRDGADAEIRVSAFPDTVFAGRVAQISPMLDPMSRSATAEVVIPNPNRKLVPGMTVSVRLVAQRKKGVVAVPVDALFSTDLTRAVVVEGTTARMRTITVGLVGDDRAEVVSGLNEGDRVVTTGKERVQDGETVKPIEAGAQ